MKLLIVDDSNIIRRRIERVCDVDDFDIIGKAGNGLEAVDIARDNEPDVVTMDITMPEMDGIACVEALMAQNKKIRILVVSALSDIETGILALEKGARGFLCKPFSDIQLRDALDELTEGMHV